MCFVWISEQTATISLYSTNPQDDGAACSNHWVLMPEYTSGTTHIERTARILNTDIVCISGAHPMREGVAVMQPPQTPETEN
jgi:hypothetical protein